MSVNKPHLYDSGLHFITFTNYKWLPLIAMSEGYDLVYKWFDHLKSNEHHICGYVVMPNHLHVLIAFIDPKQSLNKIIGNGKRFIAYGIVQRLQQAGNNNMLEQLAAGVSAYDKSRGKLHEVFEPSFDIKDCRNLRFINQKLDYIHNNPLSGKWSLADTTVDYVHSSARFYDCGEQGIYPVTNFIDLIDMDWEEVLATAP